MDKSKAPFADNPTDGLVPLSITPLCVNRMIGWATIVSHLIKYLSIVVDQEKRLSESLSKTSKELTQALASDNLALFGQEESVRSLLNDMTEQQSKRASIRSNSAMNIEEQLIPILKELLEQIKKKVTEPEQKWVQLDRDLKHDLDLYVKLSTHVKAALFRQNWKDGEVFEIPKDTPRDPWLAHVALEKHIEQCYGKQVDYRMLIKEQEDDFAAFEAVVVQNIKISLATFYDWRSGTFNQQIDQIRTVKEQLDNMDPERDWSIFKSKNKNKFLQPCPLVEVQDLKFEGYDDPALKPLKQGKLHRKEGVFKRAYKGYVGVLTPSGYFHLIPEPQKGEKFLGQPELTLDLTEYTLQPLMMNEKDPEEIAFIAKSSGMFGRDVKYKFKGQHLADSAEWWGVFNEQMRTLKERKVLPSPKLAEKEPSPVEQVPKEEPVVQEKRPASPNRAPPMPPRSKSPVPPPQEYTPEKIDYAPTFETPDYYSNPIPAPVLSPAMAGLSLSERMEMAMKIHVAPEPEIPSVIPSFEIPTRQPDVPKVASNPWDTFEADQAKW